MVYLAMVYLAMVYLAHGYSRLRRGLRGRALSRGGRSALPRLRLGYFFAHGYSCLRQGLRGRALSGRRAFALASAAPR
jgi:predicted acyl esterase